MNQHERIMRDIDTALEQLDDAETVTPSALATVLQQKYRYPRRKEPPEIEYTSLEHLKQMTRSRLRHRFRPGEDNPEADPDDEHPSLFDGLLQDRYPLPRKRGEEPTYKRRDAMSAKERAWNVAFLRRVGRSYQAHADALEAEGRDAALAVATAGDTQP